MSVVVPDQPVGTLSQAWRECVGTGRLNLALRADYQASLARTQRDIGFRYIRGHGLFSDDMGVYRPWEHDTGDGPQRGVRHSFTYVDQVVDFYLSVGIKPFVELGFMPGALASGDQTVFWWKGNVTPPKDYAAWAELVRATTAHLVDRYGLDEVRTWPIEVWNEPNLVHFWQGADQQEYFRLYEASAHAVKDVDAELQVGGPAISPGSDHWLVPFAEFTTDREVPVDFVSKHAYTSGPARHVPFGTYQTLRSPQSLLDQFATPRELLAGTALADLPVHITEFNTSYRPDNPVHDTAYNAAYLAPVLARGGDHVDSFSYWTFCDVFEEENIPTAFFHGGFGMLTHRQVPKPTYLLYTFMARMGSAVLAQGDDHLVTRHDDGRVTVLAWAPVAWNEPDDDGASATHRVRLSLPVGTGSEKAFVLRERVNEAEGNAWTAWRELGRPRYPSTHQLDVLHTAAQPGVTHWSAPVGSGRVELDLPLDRHEVTFVELAPVADETPAWIEDSRLVGYGSDS